MSATVVAELEKPSGNVVEIDPGRGLLDPDLGGEWRYRELLHILVVRALRILYRQAAPGMARAIIRPDFAFATVLPWTYCAEAVRRCGTGLVNESE